MNIAPPRIQLTEETSETVTFMPLWVMLSATMP